MILQHIRIIVGEAGYEPGTFASKEYVLVIERTAPAASSKYVSHTTSPPEVESSVEIETNSPVPVWFLHILWVQGSVG